jgi:hypothetical protein
MWSERQLSETYPNWSLNTRFSSNCLLSFFWSDERPSTECDGEFARWWEHLISTRAHVQQLLIAKGGANGDRHQDEHKNAHEVHTGLEPTGHEQQFWED